MKKFILLLMFAGLTSCNAPDKKILSPEEQLALQKRSNDSLMFVFDSLMQIKVDVPQLFDSTVISADCLNSFNTLARETGGEIKVLANSKLVAKTILEIVKSYSKDNADIMILIDKTSSMEDDLGDVKKGLNQILTVLRSYKNIRLSVGTYGDKNEDGKLWYDFQNFEKDYESTGKFINGIKITGGGDYPESVYDGIYQAFQENFWLSGSKRMVILIGDAPSLDSSKAEHTLEEIIAIAKRDKVNMNFYPIVLSPYEGELLGHVERMEKKAFINNIYPNPSTGLVSLHLESEKELTIELINQKGNVIQTKKTSNKEEKLELYEYPNGLYIVRAYDEYKNSDEKKIILNK